MLGSNLPAKPTLKAGIYSLYKKSKYKFKRLVGSLDLFRKYSYYITGSLHVLYTESLLDAIDSKQCLELRIGEI